jgi:hypothetical protein
VDKTKRILTTENTDFCVKSGLYPEELGNETLRGPPNRAKLDPQIRIKIYNHEGHEEHFSVMELFRYGTEEK